jgi:hypothetical protein
MLEMKGRGAAAPRERVRADLSVAAGAAPFPFAAMAANGGVLPWWTWPRGICILTRKIRLAERWTHLIRRQTRERI